MKTAPPKLFLICTLFLTVFAAACGPAGAPPANSSAVADESGIGKRGGSITYRFSSPPRTFNYLLAADEASIILTFFLLNDHLVSFDPLV
ncbi:MAG TPA: hypothetical protein VK918_04520, partial [Pyrinomonadaceae bacterium]|nr:hypothetical protein [Pyrinomonadaceae bacterium]